MNTTENPAMDFILKNLKDYEIKTTYTGWGWFLITVVGMSATPSKIEFVDRINGTVIVETTDREILKQFVGR